MMLWKNLKIRYYRLNVIYGELQILMKVKTIAAVMIHVPDWKEGLAWYEKAFPEAR